MQLSQERIVSLSRALVDRRYIEVTADRTACVSALQQIITEELMVEVRLNEEVRKILKIYEAEIDKGNLDYRKMFQITKKQLARDRGIIL